MTAVIALDFLIAVGTLFSIVYIGCKETFPRIIQYFTIQSNILSGVVSLVCAIWSLISVLPYWMLIVKFSATCAVSVTFVTVIVYLGPRYKNWKFLLVSETNFWLHVVGPLLAVTTLLLRGPVDLPFAMVFTGLVPVILYGMLYTKKVVINPPEKRWEDLYGFNSGVNWKLSTIAMFAGTFAVSLALRTLLACL